jgi:hypothetical protein
MPNVLFKRSAQRIHLDFFFPGIPQSQDKRFFLITCEIKLWRWDKGDEFFDKFARREREKLCAVSPARFELEANRTIGKQSKPLVCYYRSDHIVDQFFNALAFMGLQRI